jgi:hypothetical protein
LQGEILRCTYVQELDETVQSALLEQQAVMQEYETFSKTLHLEVKSYFDRVMNGIGSFLHPFNDFMERASEVNHLYVDDSSAVWNVYGDDITDAHIKQAIRQDAINREIRERQH